MWLPFTQVKEQEDGQAKQHQADLPPVGCQTIPSPTILYGEKEDMRVDNICPIRDIGWEQFEMH